jgi:carboxyl-terminal processing protease
MTRMLKQFLKLSALLFLCSCDRVFLGPTEGTNPSEMFNLLWKDYDVLYGPFIVKNINWDSLYLVYSSNINENSGQEQFYSAVTGLLSNLDDNHVFLIPTESDLQTYHSGILGRLKTFHDFKLSNIRNNYLAETRDYSDDIIYGKLNVSIGYIHLNNFMENVSSYGKTFDKILSYMDSMTGLIMDIRNNSGGMEPSAVYIAGRFTTESKTAFKFRLRNGPGHSDFSGWTEYTLKPQGKSQYTRKVILLTHRFTVSAAETFTLTMKRIPSVTVVGDTTSGAFSDMIIRELPNGWYYSISVGDWRDYSEKSFEGIGIAPDILVRNDSLDVTKGIDKALETAIGLLE